MKKVVVFYRLTHIYDDGDDTGVDRFTPRTEVAVVDLLEDEAAADGAKRFITAYKSSLDCPNCKYDDRGGIHTYEVELMGFTTSETDISWEPGSDPIQQHLADVVEDAFETHRDGKCPKRANAAA